MRTSAPYDINTTGYCIADTLDYIERKRISNPEQIEFERQIKKSCLGIPDQILSNTSIPVYIKKEKH